jgi:uncharacterized phage infection (PIP) family protein YhgE
MKQIFDNLNIQQNSIDNLSDKLAENAKDKKRINSQINQIQGMTTQQKGLHVEALDKLNDQLNSLVQRNIQYDHLLAQLKSDMNQVIKQISQLA